MEAKLERLHIDLPAPFPAQPKQRSKDVVESWEDAENDDSDIDTPTATSGMLSKPVFLKDPALAPPPPTPISPQDWSPATALGGGRPTADYGSRTPVSASPRAGTPARSDNDPERKRPEKTNATASRMIAAGLGLKVPKKTEEQKQYDKAVKENEIKRKNREKGDKEKEKLEDEKAKTAVWDS